MQKLMQQTQPKDKPNRCKQLPVCIHLNTTPLQDDYSMGDHAQPTKNDPKTKERTNEKIKTFNAATVLQPTSIDRRYRAERKVLVNKLRNIFTEGNQPDKKRRMLAGHLRDFVSYQRKQIEENDRGNSTSKVGVTAPVFRHPKLHRWSSSLNSSKSSARNYKQNKDYCTVHSASNLCRIQTF